MKPSSQIPTSMEEAEALYRSRTPEEHAAYGPGSKPGDALNVLAYVMRLDVNSPHATGSTKAGLTLLGKRGLVRLVEFEGRYQYAPGPGFFELAGRCAVAAPWRVKRDELASRLVGWRYNFMANQRMDLVRRVEVLTRWVKHMDDPDRDYLSPWSELDSLLRHRDKGTPDAYSTQGRELLRRQSHLYEKSPEGSHAPLVFTDYGLGLLEEVDDDRRYVREQLRGEESE